MTSQEKKDESRAASEDGNDVRNDVLYETDLHGKLEASDSQRLELTGWRLATLMFAIFSGLFLSFLDTSIVAVALATIADHFQDFDASSWVFTAYLLNYMAFGIILSRLSDVFGMKAVELTCMVLFLAFSLGCGLSRNMTEL